MLELQTIYDGFDIASLKIYYDTEKQQYKYKAKCDSCDEFCFCICYDTLEDAYMGYHEGIWCDKCILRETMLCEYSMLDDLIGMIAQSEDPNRIEDIFAYAISLLGKEEIDEMLGEVRANCDGSDCSGEVCK